MHTNGHAGFEFYMSQLSISMPEVFCFLQITGSSYPRIDSVEKLNNSPKPTKDAAIPISLYSLW